MILWYSGLDKALEARLRYEAAGWLVTLHGFVSGLGWGLKVRR